MANVTRFEVLSGAGAVGYRGNGDIVQAGTSINTILMDNIAAVPEPSTTAMALAGLACGGFSMVCRRKRS
jgi:predicted solute-binding protein